VKRLRTLRFRSYVLPVILAALAARAFLPPGFMTTAQGPAINVQMCSLEQDRRSPIESPVEDHDTPRCDHCLSPLGTAPVAIIDAPAPVKAAALLAQTLLHQVPFEPLQRAHSARAPPHA
jgi:hypothetical protein